MKMIAILLLGVALGATVVLSSREPVPPAHAQAPTARPTVAAAQGRVEGRTEKIEVEAGTDGVIRALMVNDGDEVSAGQIIAILACEDLEKQARSLEAALESARQARIRVLRGSRDEEKRVADEDTRSAQAVLDQARRKRDRMAKLFEQGVMPQQDAEDSQRDFDTAQAALNSALQRQKLAYAGPLPEEIKKADADVNTAEEKLLAGAAQRDKCMVRAPVHGTITRVHLHVGEAFSTVMPRPIVTMVDLSERKIRAEVDERDLGRVHLHQHVRMTAEGFLRPFGGEVVWTAYQMGRKSARSPDPAEKSDRDILEALIAPDKDAPKLPIGLRVTVEFVAE